jgi:hypothetical protein
MTASAIRSAVLSIPNRDRKGALPFPRYFATAIRSEPRGPRAAAPPILSVYYMPQPGAPLVKGAFAFFWLRQERRLYFPFRNRTINWTTLISSPSRTFR